MHDSVKQIRSIINEIPDISGAEPIRQLHGGEASSHWHIKRGEQQFVLRLDKPLAGKLGLNRKNEDELLKIVGEAGIGPIPVWSNPARGIHVCTFLPGRSWSLKDAHDGQNLKNLARTLTKLHGLPAKGQPFDPVSAAQRYASETGTRQASRIAADASSLFNELASQSMGPALCHNDLVHSNIISPELKAPSDKQGSVQLIDWEYAAIGDPLFDLAIVIQHHGLPEQLTEHFLETYCAEGAPLHRSRLKKFCLLYDLLAALWYLSMVTQSGPDTYFTTELNRVLLRLKTSGHDGAAAWTT